VPDPFFTTRKSRDVPRVAVFFKDPVVLTGRLTHGGAAVAGATLRATGFGGAVAGVTDDDGRGDVIVPALRSHRIVFSVVGFPAGTPGKVDLEVSPDIVVDPHYRVRKAQILLGARVIALGPARLGRVDLQKRIRGKWRTVQKAKIGRNLRFRVTIPKAQYRGPWRFSYVARKAPYYPAVFEFTLGKPRVARVAITGRATAGRRGH